MPIQPLPPSSIRSLSSSQVLTDPVSLIKELIENSLDASASTITIDVTPNLLNSITIRDNGIGILPSDRALVARRHATSKIRLYSDLATCKTLGFRGEALASAAALSEHLSITTRVEGEVTAETWTVGEAVRRKTSAPVGTAITVKGFLKKLPVRREVAVKQSMANGKKLKVLVGRYYLANPKCRFALRGVGQIVYPPVKSVMEGARHVLGALEWSWNETAEVECLLPRNMVKGTAAGLHYVYVDCRPVACTRGTLKLVLKAVRKCIGKDAPFWLNIKMPRDSYDPNIEPAKDDVMFHDPDKVLAVVWDVLREVYGEVLVDGKNREKQTEPEMLSGRGSPSATEQSNTREDTHRERSDADREAVPDGHEDGQGDAPEDTHPEDTDRGGSPGLGKGSDPPNRASLNVESDVDSELEVRFDEEEEMLATQLLEEATAVLSKPKTTAPSIESSWTQASTTIQTSDSAQQLENGLQVAFMGPSTPPSSSPVRRTTSNHWGSNMAFELDEDEIPFPADQPPETLPEVDEEAEREQVRNDARLSNPWTAAKAAAAMTPKRKGPNAATAATPQIAPPASSQTGMSRVSQTTSPHRTQQQTIPFSPSTLRRSSLEPTMLRTPNPAGVSSSPATSPARHWPTPPTTAPFRPQMDISPFAPPQLKQRKRPSLREDPPTPDTSKRPRVGPMDGFVTAVTVLRNSQFISENEPRRRPRRTVVEPPNDDEDLYAPPPVSHHHGVALARRRTHNSPIPRPPEFGPPPSLPPSTPRPPTRTRSLGLPPPVPAPPLEEQVLPLIKSLSITPRDLDSAQALFRRCEGGVYAWGRGREDGFVGGELAEVDEVLRRWSGAEGWRDAGCSPEGWRVVEAFDDVVRDG